MFTDRTDAGEQLARALAHYRGSDAVVLALPSGGVVLGAIVARQLGLPLDVVVVRKIGHPHNKEYAIGAVDDKGMVMRSQTELRSLSTVWFEEEAERQLREAQRRAALFRAGRQTPSLVGKTVLLIDDGMTTGFSMQLAIKTIEQRHPAKKVIAVPVSSPGAVQALSVDADEIVVLEAPELFKGSTSAHYERFPQVSDEEVVHLLMEAHVRVLQLLPDQSSSPA